MKFLVYSSTNGETIRSNLGGVDYSYYFVLQSYLPLLEQLGTVAVLDQPLSAASEQQWELDEDTWYLSFTPPNNAELSSSARILPVFAWEFGTLPDEKFITDSDDWNHVLSSVSGAITHSSFAVDVVRKSLGKNYPVVSIPAPIWNSLENVRASRNSGLLKLEALQLDCTVVDSADFTSLNGSLTSFDKQITSISRRAGRDWDGSPMHIPFSHVPSRPLHWGFTRADSGELVFAGDHAWLALPAYISGPVLLEISIISRRESAGALIRVSLGGSSAVVRLEEGLLRHRLYLTPVGSANILGFSLCMLDGRADSHITEIDDVRFVRAQPPSAQLPDGGVVDLARDESLYWYGVHHPEYWGRWTTECECGVTLPYSVSGDVRVRFSIVNALIPMNTVFKVHLGDACQELKLTHIPQRVELIFARQPGTDHLAFSGLEVQESDSAESQSHLGIGIAGLKIDSAEASQRTMLDTNEKEYLQHDGVLYTGFYAGEEWGRWTSAETSQLLLPGDISGEVTLTIYLAQNPHRFRSAVRVEIGGQTRQFIPRIWRKRYRLRFTNVSRTGQITIHGCAAKPIVQIDDSRSLGLGFSSLTLGYSELAVASPVTVSQEPGIEKQPIVYTAILSPVDGRKNLPDILSAFIFALRDKPDAVLIVKIVHSEIQQFIDDLCNYFLELAPFKCRLIFIHGYLPRDQYQALIKATHFVTNASRGEGQCLPLMEFMSSGVPAIAPDNTAMADYVRSDNTFIVKSSIEPAVWPQDPRLLFRTTRSRVNWESLYEAFIDSYQVARVCPEQYESMARQAVLSLQSYCSLETGRNNLLSFLELLKSGRERR